MAVEDKRVQTELAADGSLFDGYHPRMAGVHRRNAARLAATIDRDGWPVPALVGEDGAVGGPAGTEASVGNTICLIIYFYNKNQCFYGQAWHGNLALTGFDSLRGAES
jgi:hypothetical protein